MGAGRHIAEPGHRSHNDRPIPSSSLSFVVSAIRLPIMNNNPVFYTFQSWTIPTTEGGSSSRELWPSSQSSSPGHHNGSSQPHESPDISSTTCSDYRVRPLPVIPFLLNNNVANTDNNVMTHQPRRPVVLHEHDGRTRRVNKREWIVPEAAAEDEEMLLLLTKRARHNQTKSIWSHDQNHHRHPTTTCNTAPPLMHIDLIVSHVLGYLSWREQLHCRTVSKVWRDAYLSAPTRFLLRIESQPSRSLPRVLQPSHLDQFHNQISWNSMERIGSLARNVTLPTPADTLKKRIVRLDIYGSSGDNPGTGSNTGMLRVLNTMQLLHHTMIQSAFMVEELRLLYINHDDFDRYLRYHHDARFPKESPSSGLGTSSSSSSAVQRLVIRDQHQHSEDSTLDEPQMINQHYHHHHHHHHHRQRSLAHVPHSHLVHIQAMTPKLQVLDINTNIVQIR